MRTTISFSEMATLATCPHKHYLIYYRGLKGVPTLRLEVGTLFHSIIEEYLKQGVIPDNNEIKTKVDVILSYVDNESIEPPPLYEKDYKEDAIDISTAWTNVLIKAFEAFQSWLKEMETKGWKLDGVEEEVKFPLNPRINVTGRADLIFVNDKNERLIVDIKTGYRNTHKEIKGSTKIQLEIYAYNFQASRMGIVSIIWGSKKKEPYIEYVEDEFKAKDEIDKVITLLSATLELRETGITPPPFGLLSFTDACNYCSVKDYCVYVGGQEPDEDF